MENRPLIIAHRGGRLIVKHENTIEAFDHALSLGADMIEFDVRRSKDGKFVINHDADIDGKKLVDHTYGELLEITRKKGFEMPLLEEVITRYKDKMGLEIELKEIGYEKDILDLVRKYLDYGSYMIRSYNDSTIKAVKELDSQIKTALIMGKPQKYSTISSRISEIFPRKRILESRADFVSPHYRLLKVWMALGVDFCEKGIYVWSVNDKKMMEKFRDKVIGLITDRPDVAVEVLRK